jgi:hypothetical protein
MGSGLCGGAGSGSTGTPGTLTADFSTTGDSFSEIDSVEAESLTEGAEAVSRAGDFTGLTGTSGTGFREEEATGRALDPVTEGVAKVPEAHRPIKDRWS